MSTTAVPSNELSDQLGDVSAVLSLTAHDRCDHCGAQAWQRWMDGTSREYKDNGDLLFCYHHGNKYHKDLKAKGFELVVDESAKINAKSESSA